MIKCEYGTFECKGKKFDIQAEFEVIFMNYFEVLLKHETLEDALSLYTNILKRFNLAIEKYKNKMKNHFMIYIQILLLMKMLKLENYLMI